MTTEDIKKLLSRFRVNTESEIITTLIKSNAPMLDRLYQNWLEYKGTVPILSRTLEVGNENKLNNKLAHDFRGLIVDQSVGYMFGNPIVYYAGSDTEQNTLDDFKDYARLEDLDAQTATFSSACGYAVRMLYVDQDGKEAAMNVNPWECIFVMDGSTDQTQYVLRFYDVEYYVDDKKTTKRKVEWYDKDNVTFYISVDDDKTVYALDSTEEQNPLPHNFSYVPLVKFKNNELEQGDFEKVATIIDGYDVLMSDVQNEIEEFRLAYMIFMGTEPSAEAIVAARKTGAFGIDKEDKVEFLTKQINDGFIQNSKKTHEQNIFRFSRAVDMSDETFSGANQTGESRKWKLVDLENKCIQKERKFNVATKEQFKILASAWSKKNIPFDYTQVSLEFKRNLPKDLEYEARTSALLKGNVSEETRLSLLSFIDDPQEELSIMESEGGMNFDKIPDELPGQMLGEMNQQ